MYYSLSVTLPISRMKALAVLIETIQTQAKDRWMPDEEVLALRLAPDMYPFSRQIQIASDNAKGMASRLGGKEAPVFADAESSLDELKERLDKTVAFLETFVPSDFVWAEMREARFPYFPGMHMVGEQYLLGYAFPNFFFHAVTAYDILRHHGFDIGKEDFMHSLPLLPDAK